jgi:hypothetical protein
MSLPDNLLPRLNERLILTFHYFFSQRLHNNVFKKSLNDAFLLPLTLSLLPCSLTHPLSLHYLSNSCFSLSFFLSLSLSHLNYVSDYFETWFFHRLPTKKSTLIKCFKFVWFHSSTVSSVYCASVFKRTSVNLISFSTKTRHFPRCH